jgi:hypothetical protein
VRVIWQEELDGFRRLGGLFMLALHPQIIGRPGRLAMLESFLATARGDAGLRFATARTIAETVA